MTWDEVNDYLRAIAARLNINRDDVGLYVITEYEERAPVRSEMAEINAGNLYLLRFGSEYVRYEVRAKDRPNRPFVVTSWTLGEMPGCCAFGISTGVQVPNTFRGRGINTISNQFRCRLARFCNYTKLLCTDVAHNEPERRTLAKNGWKDILTVKNRRTGNTVHLSMHDLENL